MFAPTPASIPPPNVVLRLKHSNDLPTNITPLVSSPKYIEQYDIKRSQNPVSFLLRAALIYPNKLALSAPDGPQPVAYNFAVW